MAGKKYVVLVVLSAALAGLLSSVTPTTPLPPSTPLADLDGLFNTGQPVGHQLLGSNAPRDSSPITAVAAAAAGLLGGPPSCKSCDSYLIHYRLNSRVVNS